MLLIASAPLSSISPSTSLMPVSEYFPTMAPEEEDEDSLDERARLKVLDAKAKARPGKWWWPLLSTATLAYRIVYPF